MMGIFLEIIGEHSKLNGPVYMRVNLCCSVFHLCLSLLPISYKVCRV